MDNNWTPQPMTFVCEVPASLGRVTKLEQRGGRVVATTESGIEFIVPTKTSDQK